MSKRFTEKVALVFGASRGLGRAIALELGEAGAQVIASARTEGALTELDDAVQAAGGPPVVLAPLDLLDAGALDRLGAVLFERWGRLDILVNCAAHAPPLTPVAHAAFKEVDRAFGVNAFAVQRMARAFDPLLSAAPSARALFMTDDKTSRAYWGPYAASKAAGAAFAAAYRAEKEAGSVKVEIYAPPAMPTALRGRFYPGEDRTKLTKPRQVAADVVGKLLAI